MNEIDSISTNLTTLTTSTDTTTFVSEQATVQKKLNKDCNKKINNLESSEPNEENQLVINARIIDSSADFSLNSSFEDSNLTLVGYEKRVIAKDNTKVEELNNLLNNKIEENVNQTEAIDNKDVEKNLSCSFYRIRKNYFADIRCFTFFMCLIVMFTNALIVGYRNSVITTIEKRFEFSSVLSGILSGCLEFGSLIGNLKIFNLDFLIN